jgi:hypothetical protein
MRGCLEKARLQDGMIASVRAGARARTVAGRMIPTPWEGRLRS